MAWFIFPFLGEEKSLALSVLLQGDPLELELSLGLLLAAACRKHARSKAGDKISLMLGHLKKITLN
jgi:hypothetical protein